MPMAKKSDDEIEADAVETLIRDEVVGSKKWTVDRLKNSGFKSSDQGRVDDIVRKLVKDPNAPLEYYGGGARDNVRLTSIDEAREWLNENHDRDLWWM